MSVAGVPLVRTAGHGDNHLRVHCRRALQGRQRRARRKGSMKITTHLNHKSHCKTMSSTNW